jgi:hypothetical protein
MQPTAQAVGRSGHCWNQPRGSERNSPPHPSLSENGCRSATPREWIRNSAGGAPENSPALPAPGHQGTEDHVPDGTPEPAPHGRDEHDSVNRPTSTRAASPRTAAHLHRDASFRLAGCHSESGQRPDEEPAFSAWAGANSRFLTESPTRFRMTSESLGICQPARFKIPLPV